MSDAIEAMCQTYLRGCGAYMTEGECPECEFAIQHQLGPAIAAYRDSEIEALRGQVAQHEANANRALAECQALVAKLADCQAVIRHKGHDADCPKMLCGRCGYGAYGHWERFPPHVMVESSDPCSDACGHDRTTGEKV